MCLRATEGPNRRPGPNQPGTPAPGGRGTDAPRPPPVRTRFNGTTAPDVLFLRPGGAGGVGDRGLTHGREQLEGASQVLTRWPRPVGVERNRQGYSKKKWRGKEAQSLRLRSASSPCAPIHLLQWGSEWRKRRGEPDLWHLLLFIWSLAGGNTPCKMCLVAQGTNSLLVVGWCLDAVGVVEVQPRRRRHLRCPRRRRPLHDPTRTTSGGTRRRHEWTRRSRSWLPGACSMRHTCSAWAAHRH